MYFLQKIIVLITLVFVLFGCGSSGGSGGNNESGIGTSNKTKKAPNTPSVTLSSSIYYGESYTLKATIDNTSDYGYVYNDSYTYFVSYQKKGSYSWHSEIEKSYEPITLYTTDITGFQAGDEYKVRIRVKNKAGYSGYGYSDYVKIGEKKVEATVKKVAKPTGINTRYYKSLKQVTARWDYQSGVDKYYISYKKQSSSVWSAETSTTSISESFNTGNISGKYKFRIRAYSGGIYSEYSYSEYVDIEDTSTISTPTNLSVTYYRSLEKFSLSWSDDYVGISAHISWKELSDYSWSDEKDIPNAVSYESVETSNINNFKEGNSYKFRVRIKKDGKYSSYVESGYIQAGDKPTPKTPTNLQINYLKYVKTFQLSWDVDYGFLEYDGSFISWRKLGGSWSNEEETTITSKNISDSDIEGFEAGSSYKFRVRIKKDGIYSGYKESGYISTN